MKTLISAVRPGEVLNPHDLFYGRLRGFPLSEIGRLRARFAALDLRERVIAAFYSSRLPHARETAEIIAAEHPGGPVHETDLLTEVYSPFEGRPIQQVRDCGFDLYREADSRYEQPQDLLLRWEMFSQKVRRDHPGQQVVAVMPGEMIAFLLVWVEGRPVVPGERPQPYPAPCSISTFGYRTDAPDEVPDCVYWDPSGRIAVTRSRHRLSEPHFYTIQEARSRVPAYLDTLTAVPPLLEFTEKAIGKIG